ncbi:MAG: SprT-like domain-containing protein [Prevotella sp.]|nr:SprT-like domain-containing protein [Prevotella sp.]
MQVTVDWIESHFCQFNREYFGGELPLPKFSVCNARTRLGALRFKWKAVRTGFFSSSVKRQCYDYEIRISNYYDIPEREYQNTLLHEMIHYYIAVKNLRDTSVHGTTFRRLMNQLNAKGWGVTVRTDTKGWPVARRNEGKPRIVLAGVTTENKCFLSVVSPRYVRTIDRMASKNMLIKNHSWHVTTNDYFRNFPQSRTLRGKVVSKDFFEKTVAAMQPLTLS